MVVEQAFETVLEQRALRELVIAAEDVVVALPLGPYDDVADTIGVVQLESAESVSRSLRKVEQVWLIPEGIKGFVVEDAARAVMISNDTIAKYFIAVNF